MFIIPGIIKSFSYAMTYFIINDHPEYSLNQAITESRRMMDGHKMEYFILCLSFIGWFILSCITLGIGFLWLIPYFYTTSAAFTKRLQKNIMRKIFSTKNPRYELFVHTGGFKKLYKLIASKWFTEIVTLHIFTVMFCRNLSCFSVSIPSATTERFKVFARESIVETMARSSGR